MLKVGITGGIGSGKTIVSRVFSVLGVPVYNADLSARSIMNTDRNVLEKLSISFGEGIIKEGVPDRQALAQIVFNDPDALKRINEIIHPAVRADFAGWLEKQREVAYIVKEAAILFESGAYAELDTVILITAPEETRIRRIIKRDGDTVANIKNRMANQWPDETKALKAGFVIENDNTSAVLPVILEMHSKFSKGYMPGYK
ncbi:MAG: dephospho-CoA kinase [Bacteroidales bacterium]